LVLEEITVTAQKREENLQQTPIAITALDADALTRAGVREFTDLEKVEPSVRVDRVVGMPRVAIRGIFATNLSPTSESPNAVHMDGAYLPKASSLGAMFFDVERMEVLKGPQGTLYGRNSNGGAVNIISRRPGNEFGVDAQVEGGNYDTRRVEAAVNVPITDTFSARVAGNLYQHDGYYQNGLEDADEKSGRVSFLWKPDDKQSLLLTYDQEKIDNKGPGVINGLASPSPNTIIPPVFNNTSIYGSNPPFYYQMEQYGLMGQYDYSFDAATLTIQVANRHQGDTQDFLAGGIDGLLPNDQFSPGAVSHEAGYTITTAEARLSSATTRPLEWVVGVFAMDLKNTGGIRFFGDIPASAHSQPLVEQGNPYEKAKAYAVFAQGTYTPESMERLHLTLGARYTRDEKEATTTITGALIPTDTDLTDGNSNEFNGSQTWGAATWRAALAFDLTDSSMLYTSVSRGYAAGGFAFAPYGANPEYKPEFVTAYEIGSKNRFFDDRLQVNVEAFYSDYTDLASVYSYFLPGAGLVIGIGNGDAEYKGASIDVQTVISDHDRLRTSLAYLDTEYKNYDLRKYNADQLFDWSGTRINSTAPWVGNASYTHTWDILGGALDAELGFQYRARMQVDADFQGTPSETFTYTEDVTRWDFSMRYAAPQQSWDVTAYVRNLADDVDYSTKAYSARVPGVINGIPMSPRTYGVVVGVHF
jgi:iron complex outermembrane receptor protein